MNSLSSTRAQIVILSAFFRPFRSGAEAMVEEVALRLKDEYDITIVTARLSSKLPRTEILSDRITIRRVGLGRSIDKWLFPLLGAIAVMRRKPKIVHAVLESYAGLALVMCRFLSPTSKRILTLQSTNTSMFLKRMHRTADVITAISSYLILRAKEYGRSDVIYIPNGIALDDIRHALTRYPREHGRILFVGRLEPMKGVDTLLEAFAMLQDLPVTLMIVGDGSERARLEALTEELRIADRVSFQGFIETPKIYDIYAQAEVFAGLSRSEALGNVFLEAQAAQLAVVATSVGGIPEIVKDKETGILVRPDEPKAAAAALRQLFEDTILRQRLVEASQTRLPEFDWNAIAARYDSVYKKIL